MLAELAGRSVENLVLLPASELELLRARSKGRALLENYAWRTAAAVIPLVLAIIFLPSILAWLGNANPSARTLSGLAFVPSALAGLAVHGRRLARLQRFERDPGLYGLVMAIVVPLVPAAPSTSSIRRKKGGRPRMIVQVIRLAEPNLEPVTSDRRSAV